MGQDKRFLSIEGVALIDRTIRVLENIFEEVVVVLARPIKGWSAARHRVVYDVIPDCGSLGGLYTGLIESDSPRIFAAACDMPFLNPGVIRYLIDADPEADVVGVRLENGFQPMHAVYSRRCIPILERMARSGSLKIQGLFKDPLLKVKVISETELIKLDPELRSFRNVNTPSDFISAQTLLSECRDY